MSLEDKYAGKRTPRRWRPPPALHGLSWLTPQVEIIQGLPDDAIISLYRCGPMVDLCHGPHLPNTGYIKAHAVHNVSRAFWRADVTRDPLMVRPLLVPCRL